MAVLVVLWLYLWQAEVCSLLVVGIKIWHSLLQVVILLVYDVVLSQDFQPVQMLVFSLRYFVQWGCLYVALSVNATALLQEGGVAFPEENKV